MKKKLNMFFFVDPVSYTRNSKHRGTTVSSFASSIVNNLVNRPCWLCRRYVVHERHLIEEFFTVTLS